MTTEYVPPTPQPGWILITADGDVYHAVAAKPNATCPADDDAAVLEFEVHDGAVMHMVGGICAYCLKLSQDNDSPDTWFQPVPRQFKVPTFHPARTRGLLSWTNGKDGLTLQEEED